MCAHDLIIRRLEHAYVERRRLARPSSSTNLSHASRIARFIATRSLRAPFFQLHLAAKHPVDKNKITYRQHRGENPPRQANAQPVMPRSRVINSQVIAMIASRQHHRIKSKGRTREHKSDIETRSSECQLFF